MTIVRTLDEPRQASALLRVLRDKLDDATFDHRLARAVAQGYRVLAAYDDDRMVGALGYRLTDDLCWGRTFYIDDLVVHPGYRSGGIGAQLLAAAREVASKDCDAIRLCSDLTRENAHRFYEANELDRFSLQFVGLV